MDHQQLVGRTRFVAEHDPAEPDLGIDREDQLGKLCFADAPIERTA